MFKRIANFFKSHKLLRDILLIFIVVFASHWLVSFMWYGQDDHSLIFKLLHIPESAGQYGSGLWARNTPYRYIVVPFVPILYIFGTNAFPYFFISIFNYFFAALAVYYLTLTLTHKRLTALVSALIFSAGFVGSDSMLRLTNSYQVPHTIIFMCLSIAFFKKHIDSKNIKFRYFFYFLALFLSAFTMEGFWVRAHGMILLILGTEFLFNLNWKSVFRMAPFLYIYYELFIKGNSSVGDSVNLRQQLSIRPFEVLNVWARSVQNLFLPDNIVSDKLVWLPILFVLVLIGVLIWKKSREMWFGIGFTISILLVYLLFDTQRVITTTHRYSTMPYVGVAIFLGIFLGKLFKNKKTYLLVSGALILFNIIQNNVYFAKNIRERTAVTKRFYESLKKEMPVLPKGSIVYFDIASDPESARQYKENFGVGNMPDTTAIAWQYGIDRDDLKRPDTFMEILDAVKKNKVTKDKIFTFFFEADRGLVSTTDLTRKVLFSQSQPVSYQGPENLDFQFSTPIEVSMQISSKTDPNQIKFNPNIAIDVKKYLGYLDSKKNYYLSVRATALTEWENERFINLIDNDASTLWMSDRLVWRDRHSDVITIDLGKAKYIGAVHLIYNSKSRAPSEYNYKCSVDDRSWLDIGSFKFLPSSDSVDIFNKINPSICRFIKLEITDSFAGDSPELAEVEVIEASYGDIDIAKSYEIQKDPFLFLRNGDDLTALNKYLSRNGLRVQVCFYTDKSRDPFCQPINIFPNSTRYYSVIIPSNGTLLKSIDIHSPNGMNIIQGNVKVFPLTFRGLDTNGYIPNFIDK